MLSLVNGTIAHGKSALYEDASMRLAPGEIKGLVAPNGYGKTTLMRILSGDLSYLKKGAVALNRINMKRDFARKEVVYIPGDASMLYPHLSVKSHLNIVHDVWGSSLSVQDAAEMWGVTGFLNKPVRSLSQGMKQQASLAVASLCSAPYLLLDEPTNALDPINVHLSIENFKHMAQDGTGILISSHILGTLDALCDSIVFVHEKKLKEVPHVEDAQELFERFYMRSS